MKKSLVFLIALILILQTNKIFGQDFSYSQFEFAPQFLNPSYSGDFDGNSRLLSSYENQWRSVLSEDSYRKGMVSFDSKLPVGKIHSIGLGGIAIFEKAGATNFRNNKLSFITSYSYNISNTEKYKNTIGLGLEVGIASRGFENRDSTSALNNPIYYPDVGAGLHWKFEKYSRLKIRIGYSIFHLNKPNISLSPDNEVNYEPKLIFHGEIEVFLANRISVLPSLIISSENPHKQNLFRMSGKLLFKESDKQNWLQIGMIGKRGVQPTNEQLFHSYGIGSILKLNNFNFGITVMHHSTLNSNSFEFLFGYIFNRKIESN